MKLEKDKLSVEEISSLQLLIARVPNPPIELEGIWYLMDSVWDEMGCNNNGNLDWVKINKFYHHPVWILNGLFIEQHDLSMQHRYAISDWIKKKKLKTVLDYGGGFGTLSRLIAVNDTSISIDIYEPHPSNYAIAKTNDFLNIHFVHSFDQKYDCVVCLDVLEHVSDPLALLSKMVESTNIFGYLLIANNFYPVIKCHLPSTFHLRHTFNRFASIMGLKNIGLCDRSHAVIYRKVKTVTFKWWKMRLYEVLSRKLFLLLNVAIPYVRRIKNYLPNK